MKILQHFIWRNVDSIISFLVLPYIRKKADSAENQDINGVKKADFNGSITLFLPEQKDTGEKAEISLSWRVFFGYFLPRQGSTGEKAETAILTEI